jgi:hypothetical protein
MSAITQIARQLDNLDHHTTGSREDEMAVTTFADHTGQISPLFILPAEILLRYAAYSR